MMSTGDIRIALLHDELIRRGGAEIVFEELVRTFPKADVYALYAGRPRITVNGKTHPVKTTFLQNFPVWFKRHPRRLLPLLPYAAEQIDLSKYDVVVSSSSAFIKGIITRANVPHICYCHTPTRYLWDATHEVTSHHPLRALARLAIHYLRLMDFSAAARVNVFVANSLYTKQRIASYYRRDSQVVYPPIDTAFFHPAPIWQRFRSGPKKPAPFLVVGRLTATKHFDQAVVACEKLQQPLVVVGVGPELGRLQRLNGKYTQFVGKVSKEKLRTYYRSAQALLQPGIEDFGMAAAEAQACGTPVIAYGVGGVREIVAPGESGYFYKTQRIEALAEAIRQFITSDHHIRIEQCQRQALRFTTNNFQTSIKNIVETVIAQRQTNP